MWRFEVVEEVGWHHAAWPSTLHQYHYHHHRQHVPHLGVDTEHLCTVFAVATPQDTFLVGPGSRPAQGGLEAQAHHHQHHPHRERWAVLDRVDHASAICYSWLFCFLLHFR